MREFRAYEYVDGDIKVYAREKGQGDDAWKELGQVTYEARLKTDATTIAANLGVDLVNGEAESLSMELAWPRRVT